MAATATVRTVVPMRRSLLHRLGLRQRVVVAFAVGALALSAGSALATWWSSSAYLQSQRTRVATSEAAVAAQIVQQGLAGGADVPQLLDRVSGPGTEALVRTDGQWFASQLALSVDDVPGGVAAAVADGRAVRQRAVLDGQPRLFIAFPLTAPGDALIAVMPLSELDATLRTLSVVLLGAATTTALAGLALGVWSSRRALRPLVRVNAAAAAVAAGDLSASMQSDDPDLARLAETFNATVADLRARIERDVRFAADVSHELRTPLATLTNAVDVLSMRRHELSETGQQVLDMMSAEVARFSRIVRDLLEISLEDADTSLVREPTRLGELVRAAVGHLVPVTVERAAECAVVSADRRRLERVVCNLVENADAHGGGALAVRVRRAEAEVRVEVDDAGPGVPVELRREVFERFYRDSTARSGADGAGLGLALVARHVRRHDGRVWVQDRPGGGARFVVTLPVEEQEPR